MKILKKVLRLVAVVTASGVVLMFLFTCIAYQAVFGRRFEADARPLGLTVSDFPGLLARSVSFASRGGRLRGNFYRSEYAEQKFDALLIFCHGFSNGSRDYLAQINFFTQQGFEVLAYDNTGCYSSDGDGVEGLPTAVINLHDVLTALGQSSDYAQMPLVLMGHSWGGYAVNAVLASPIDANVRAVVSFSAPNESLSMLIEQGRALLGDGIELLRPFLWAVERIKFGRFAGYCAVDGVNRTQAQVLSLHSEDDAVVGYPSSLAAQYALFTNPNAEILLIPNKGHNTALSDEAQNYARQFTLFAEDPRLLDRELQQLLRDADKMRLYQLDQTVMRQVLDWVLPAI